MQKEIIENWLKENDRDNPIARAEMARALVKTVYDFVKFHRPEGYGFDGKDGPERQSLAKIMDAAEDHYVRMLEQMHSGSSTR